MIHMVNHWHRLGVVTEKPGPKDGALDVPPAMYVETDRGELET